ncbi:MAG TPA: hypothetical protein VHX37_06790 [Acidobacteriaceae bacterium]|nr:hypothetical protein [Acidobacteriaceae bacterium]
MSITKWILWAYPLIACQFAPGQQQQQQAVVRDSQGVSILGQVLAAAGGSAAVAAINDYTATGTVTYYWRTPAEGSVTVRGSGVHEFRLDASLSGGERSWIVNGNSSYLKNPDGSTTNLPSQNTVRSANNMFPLLTVLRAVQDPSLNVSYAGVVSHDGQQLDEVTVRQSVQNDPTGAMGKITQEHIFIDPQALTVFSIEDYAYARNGLGDYPHELQFGGYQSVSGVLVPLSISESISGQKTLLIQLNQMKFNSGLTESDFE